MGKIKYFDMGKNLFTKNSWWASQPITPSPVTAQDLQKLMDDFMKKMSYLSGINQYMSGTSSPKGYKALLISKDGESQEMFLHQKLHFVDVPEPVKELAHFYNESDTVEITMRRIRFKFDHVDESGTLIYKEQLEEGECFPE